MKRTKKHPHLTVYTPSCPNEADDQFFADRSLDLLTGIVSLMGFTCAMVVLFILA